MASGALDPDQLIHALAATTLNDNIARKSAEAVLKELSVFPGFLTTCLSVVQNADVPFEGKLAGALALKRAILANWVTLRATGGPSPYPEEEKKAIRDALFAATASHPEQSILNAFADIGAHVFRHDFPDRWSDMPSVLLAALTSGDPKATFAACVHLRGFCKTYEVGPEAMEAIIAPLFTVVGPSLLSLTQYLVENGNNDEAAHCLRYILKAYFHVMTHCLDRVPQLCAPETFIAWCGVANSILAKPLPEPGEEGEPAGMPVGLEQRQRWIWWRVKKWAVKIMHRLADNWGQPALMDDDTGKRLAGVFNGHIAPEVCKTVCALLHGWQESGRYLTPRILLYGVHFLQSALDFSSAWKGCLKEELPFLLQSVVFNLLKLRPEEVELMETSPWEFMVSEDDPRATNLDPRSSAQLFLYAVLQIRKAAAMPIIDAMLQGGLQTYATAAEADKDPVFIDAMLHMIVKLHEWLVTDKERKKHVEWLLTTHVAPHLASPQSYLRARAIQVYVAYSDFKMKDRDNFVAVLGQIYSLLDDPSLLVKVTAGGSLAAFIARSKTARKTLEPHVVTLLQKLFTMLDDLGTSEVVNTVNVVCEAYADQLPELAMPLLTKLDQLWRAILDEEVDEAGLLSDNNIMAGEALLVAIKTVVNELFHQKKEDVLHSLLPILLSLADTLFTPKGPQLEFCDEGFDILGDVIMVCGDRVAEADAVWALYPKMLAFFKEGAGISAYTKMLMYPLDCLYGYAPARFAVAVDPTTGLDHAAMLCQLAASIEDRADEAERGWMCRVIISMLHNCRGLIDRVIPGLARLYGATSRKAHTKLLRSQGFAVVCSCLMYSPELTLSGFETEEGGSTTADVFAAIVEGIGYRFVKKSQDAQLCMLGIANLLKTVPLASMPPGVTAVLPQLVCCFAALQARYEDLVRYEKAARDRKQDEEEEMDEEFDHFKFGTANVAGGKDGAAGGDDDDDDDDASYQEHDADAEEEEEADAERALNPGDDEDYISPMEVAHLEGAKRRAAEEAARKAAKAAGAEELPDGDDEAEWEDDLPPPPSQGPLSHVRQLIWVQDAINTVMGQPGTEALKDMIPPPVQEALATMVEKANQLRAEGRVAGEFGPPPPDWKPPAADLAEDGIETPAEEGAAATGSA